MAAIGLTLVSRARFALSACLWLASCASAPAEIVRINSDVNDRATYQHYAKKDFRYLNVGDSGNCAAFAWTKFADLALAGYSPQIKTCVLETGEGHAYVLVDGWALDNRIGQPVRERDIGCRE